MKWSGYQHIREDKFPWTFSSLSICWNLCWKIDAITIVTMLLSVKKVPWHWKFDWIRFAASILYLTVITQDLKRQLSFSIFWYHRISNTKYYFQEAWCNPVREALYGLQLLYPRCYAIMGGGIKAESRTKISISVLQ